MGVPDTTTMESMVKILFGEEDLSIFRLICLVIIVVVLFELCFKMCVRILDQLQAELQALQQNAEPGTDFGLQIFMDFVASFQALLCMDFLSTQTIISYVKEVISNYYQKCRRLSEKMDLNLKRMDLEFQIQTNAIEMKSLEKQLRKLKEENVKNREELSQLQGTVKESSLKSKKSSEILNSNIPFKKSCNGIESVSNPCKACRIHSSLKLQAPVKEMSSLSSPNRQQATAQLRSWYVNKQLENVEKLVPTTNIFDGEPRLDLADSGFFETDCELVVNSTNSSTDLLEIVNAEDCTPNENQLELPNPIKIELLEDGNKSIRIRF